MRDSKGLDARNPRPLGREEVRKCKTEACKEIQDFLHTKDGTLEVIDKAPKAYPGLKKMIRRIIKEEEKSLHGVLLGEDIISAMYSGYKNALMGFLRSAEESNRFMIERACLSVFVTSTTEKYLNLLKSRKWHILVDEGLIIRNEGEGLGRIKRFARHKVKLDGVSVYLMGRPLCEKHLKFPEFSMEVKEIERALGFKIDAKCYLCSRKARYFTLSMPKASALIGLAGHIKGKDVSTLRRTYSNLSRILHPYGFNELEKDKVFTIWARDFLTVVSEINNLLDLVHDS